MNNQSIAVLLASGTPIKSLEFFPPKTDKDGENLYRAARRLQAFEPDVVSVTYGAGGSTRSLTRTITAKLQNEFEWLMMPHLTCVGSNRDELHQIIQDYHDSGFRNIMALRGDPPKGQDDFIPVKDGFAHASDLIAYIVEHFPDICLGVAGYPEKHSQAESLEKDLQHLKFKVEQGGDFITTQLFYDNSHYYSFVEKLRSMGVKQPVLPGILPVMNIDQAKRFGASLPLELEKQLLASAGDLSAQREIGIQWAIKQSADLLTNGAPGIHIYCMNRSKSALAILDGLRRKGFYL